MKAKEIHVIWRDMPAKSGVSKGHPSDLGPCSKVHHRLPFATIYCGSLIPGVQRSAEPSPQCLIFCNKHIRSLLLHFVSLAFIAFSQEPHLASFTNPARSLYHLLEAMNLAGKTTIPVETSDAFATQ